MRLDFSYMFNMIFVANIVLVLIIIFFERHSPVHALAWIIALMFLPVVGFLAYMLVGRGLSPLTRAALLKKGENEQGHMCRVNAQIESLRAQDGIFSRPEIMPNLPLIHFCLENAGLYTVGNSIKIFTDGGSKFAALFDDINNAKKSIHISYFIFNSDGIGKELLLLLAKKAKQGVKVRLLYDSFGSLMTRHSFFKPLEDAGGHVIRFFPSIIGISFLTLRVNFRNHRKIVVIDGQIGYTGGINVGDEYLGRHKRVRPWRDTHMRISGSAAGMLQRIFLSDWQYAAQEKYVITPPGRKIVRYDVERETAEGIYFSSGDSGVGVQILTGGPEDGKQAIKLGIIKAILDARKYVYMQSPYFAPDDSFMDALRVAARSGVDVRIILPEIKDKELAFRATMSYLPDILGCGVKVFLYPGFMHSKMTVIDDKFVTIGTTNLDVRSFSLNFEDNVFCYSDEVAIECRAAFEADMWLSMPVTTGWYFCRSATVRGWESVCRLLTPLV